MGKEAACQWLRVEHEVLCLDDLFLFPGWLCTLSRCAGLVWSSMLGQLGNLDTGTGDQNQDLGCWRGWESVRVKGDSRPPPSGSILPCCAQCFELVRSWGGDPPHVVDPLLLGLPCKECSPHPQEQSQPWASRAFTWGTSARLASPAPPA